ncbi:MAG TPA: hypothetical protein VHK01_02190, partial [Lacipirellulaceae bacterium]|nr:hypothetical protein [Lacipirellulaceae bacterium]
MPTYNRTFASFEELENFLRDWFNWGDTPQYEFIGLMTLFCACLDNLLENQNYTWIDEYEFTADQRAFLKRVLEISQQENSN